MPPIPLLTDAMRAVGACKMLEVAEDLVDGWETPMEAAEIVWNAMADAYLEPGSVQPDGGSGSAAESSGSAPDASSVATGRMTPRSK
jgi:hypothetical protein